MGPDVREIGDAEDEADRVEDIRLAAAVESRDGVELMVEAGNDGALGVRLEPVDDDLFYEHGFYFVFLSIHLIQNNVYFLNSESLCI